MRIRKLFAIESDPGDERRGSFAISSRIASSLMTKSGILVTQRELTCGKLTKFSPQKTDAKKPLNSSAVSRSLVVKDPSGRRNGPSRFPDLRLALTYAQKDFWSLLAFVEMNRSNRAIDRFT